MGSGFIDQETGKESEEPLYIHITSVHLVLFTRIHFQITTRSLFRCHSGPDEGQVARAKVLTEDLLTVVRVEHAKMATMVAQQQMELHQAQAQYAAYSAMAVGLNTAYSHLIIRSRKNRIGPFSRPLGKISSIHRLYLTYRRCNLATVSFFLFRFAF